MTSRLASSTRMSAAGLLKVQTRLAEVSSTIASLTRQIDESAEFTKRIRFSEMTPMREYKMGIEATLSEGSNFSLPARVREEVESRLRSRAEVKEGSELLQEWQVEISAAERMGEESLKDFARLSHGPDKAYPAQLVEAFRDDQVAVLDSGIYARGMFARDKAGSLLVMISATSLVRFPEYSISLGEAISRGYKFIMFDTEDYLEAVSEAAAIDDASKEVTPANKAKLFSDVVPEVAQQRKSPSLVHYPWARVRLPAPYFPYPVKAGADGSSEALKELAASQTIIAEWTEADAVLIDSREDVTLHAGRSTDVPADVRMRALLEFSRATGKSFSVADYAVVGDGWSRGSALTAAKEFVMDSANWGDFRATFAACSDLEKLRDAAAQMLRAAFAGVLTLPEDASFAGWTGWEGRNAFNMRAAAIQREANLAEMEATLAEGRARKEAEAALAPTPSPIPAPTPEPAAPVSPQAVEKGSFRLSPWTSGKTGEKRVYFNGVPGAQKSDKAYGFENSDKGLVIVVKAVANEAGLRADIQRELSAMNAGVPVTTFARLEELAGVVLPPAEAVVANADGIVGLAGETKANMAIIKAAAASAGGRAFWMGSKDKLQWNVPAKAWQIIQQNHPDAAKALYCVPA